MKNIIKQIKQGAKHTKLTVSEKAEIKSALVWYAKANPAKVRMSIPSPFSIYNLRNKKSISVLVISGLLLGSTVSFAAEDSIPGDVLFPVKIHLNENVRGTFAITPKAKAEWEVQLVERRLEEVEKIAMTPDALPEVHQIAEQNLERYSERVKHRIEKFEENEDNEDALETASSLSDVFNNHEIVLVGLNKNITEDEIIAMVVAGASTTTPVSLEGAFSGNDQTKDTLKKVRGARNEANKKQKELEGKRDRAREEDNKNNDTRKDQVVDATTQQESRVSNRQTENSKRVEEIRSSGHMDEELSSDEIKNLEELKKSEDKKEENERSGKKNDRGKE